MSARGGMRRNETRCSLVKRLCFVYLGCGLTAVCWEWRSGFTPSYGIAWTAVNSLCHLWSDRRSSFKGTENVPAFNVFVSDLEHYNDTRV